MSYSEFTFQSLRDTLSLHLMQDASLFAHVKEVTAIPAHGAMSYTTIASEQSAGDLTSILL